MGQKKTEQTTICKTLLMSSVREISSCCTCGTSRVTLVTARAWNLWQKILFLISHCELPCIYIPPAANVYGVYDMIRYPRVWSIYPDFMDREFLLTLKLLNQRFKLVKSSLRKIYFPHHHLTVTEYMCNKGPWISSLCRNHNHIISSFVIYHHILARLTRMLPLFCWTDYSSMATLDFC